MHWFSSCPTCRTFYSTSTICWHCCLFWIRILVLFRDESFQIYYLAIEMVKRLRAAYKKWVAEMLPRILSLNCETKPFCLTNRKLDVLHIREQNKTWNWLRPSTAETSQYVCHVANQLNNKWNCSSVIICLSDLIDLVVSSQSSFNWSVRIKTWHFEQRFQFCCFFSSFRNELQSGASEFNKREHLNICDISCFI